MGPVVWFAQANTHGAVTHRRKTLRGDLWAPCTRLTKNSRKQVSIRTLNSNKLVASMVTNVSVLATTLRFQPAKNEDRSRLMFGCLLPTRLFRIYLCPFSRLI